MTVQIAVCDDEEYSLKEHQKMLKQIAGENGWELELKCFRSGEELLDAYSEKWDMILLDVQMEGADGFKIAEKIRENDREMTILFVTNLRERAIEGYSVQAFQYLAKPVPFERFRYEIEKAMEASRRRRGTTISLRSGNLVFPVSVNDILYVEARSGLCDVHLPQQVIRASCTLQKLETELKDYGFSRCHIGFLINLSKVDHVGTAEVVLANSETIPISRHRKKQLLLDLAQYLGEII